MKKVISKLDGKEYYLTVCNDESNHNLKKRNHDSTY